MRSRSFLAQGFASPLQQVHSPSATDMEVPQFWFADVAPQAGAASWAHRGFQQCYYLPSKNPAALVDNSYALVHTSSKWQSQDGNPDLKDSEILTLSCHALSQKYLKSLRSLLYSAINDVKQDLLSCYHVLRMIQGSNKNKIYFKNYQLKAGGNRCCFKNKIQTSVPLKHKGKVSMLLIQYRRHARLSPCTAASA